MFSHQVSQTNLLFLYSTLVETTIQEKIFSFINSKQFDTWFIQYYTFYLTSYNTIFTPIKLILTIIPFTLPWPNLHKKEKEIFKVS